MLRVCGFTGWLTKYATPSAAGELERALRDQMSAILREVQLAYPHRGDVNHMMALILSNLGRPEQAEPYHARAVSTDFFDASTWTMRAPASLSSRVPTPV